METIKGVDLRHFLFVALLATAHSAHAGLLDSLNEDQLVNRYCRLTDQEIRISENAEREPERKTAQRALETVMKNRDEAAALLSSKFGISASDYLCR